jgi:DNA-binding transcriptional MerR regulator
MVEDRANLTMDQLIEEAGAYLRKLGFSGMQQDRRITSVPDLRTIRYYSTLGLLDRPAMIGREARYGRRHVLQLVAIKVFQANSINLSEIQARLYSKSDRELEAILSAFAADRSEQVAIRPVVWREIVIEPGLKILADEKWSGDSSDSELSRRILAAIAVLAQQKK